MIPATEPIQHILEQTSSVRIARILNRAAADVRAPFLPSVAGCNGDRLIEEAERHIERYGPESLPLYRLLAAVDALLRPVSGWGECSPVRSFIDGVTGGFHTGPEDCSWTPVPCLFAGDRDSYVRYVVCGIRRRGDGECLIPGNFEALMDEPFMSSVSTAFEAALSETGQRFSLCCFPVGPPAESCLYNGDSAGLAVYLGVRHLIGGGGYPLDVAATGRMDGGRIGAVGFLGEKIRRAVQAGFSRLIYPGANGWVDGRESGPMTCFPVEDPDHAYRVSRSLESGSRDALLFHRYSESPDVFASHCDKIPESCIDLLEGRLNRLVEGMSSSGDMFGSFVRRFEAIVGAGRYGYAVRLAAAVDRVFPDGIPFAPDIAADWYCRNLELSNHTGNLRQASLFADKAESFKAELLKTENGRRLLFLLGNFRFVHERHNHYVFTPDLPVSLPGLIEKAEILFAVGSEGVEGASEPMLASIYGTITQNFGFCGPGSIQETVTAAMRAITAFGGTFGGNSPASRTPDCVRIYHYLTYAFLDAGDYSEAEKYLCLYFGKTMFGEIADGYETWSEWQHALYVRFLADTGNRGACRDYLDGMLLRGFPLPSGKHPWQLWCHNMARCALICGMTDTAKNFAKKSLSLCMAPEMGETVRVMALLPLALIHALGLMDRHGAVSAYERTVQAALSINPDHFSFLRERPFADAMEWIRTRPEAVFPFTYR